MLVCPWAFFLSSALIDVLPKRRSETRVAKCKRLKGQIWPWIVSRNDKLLENKKGQIKLSKNI
jgi:hypothetical protein